MTGLVQRVLPVLLAAVALALVACGSNDELAGGRGAGQHGGREGGARRSAESKDATGTVTFCAGKDNSGGYHSAVERFNARYDIRACKAKLSSSRTGPTSSASRRSSALQAKSSDCDVYQSDIIWIAEFAQQKWIMDLSDYAKPREDEFIPSTLAPNEYDGKLLGRCRR